jgi:hypothetical protein
MALPHAITITHRELCSKSANNPFGTEEAVKDVSCHIMTTTSMKYSLIDVVIYMNNI